MSFLPSDASDGRPLVVIVGGGFAGIAAARALRGSKAAITLIDRQNHHFESTWRCGF